MASYSDFSFLLTCTWLCSSLNVTVFLGHFAVNDAKQHLFRKLKVSLTDIVYAIKTIKVYSRPHWPIIGDVIRAA